MITTRTHVIVTHAGRRVLYDMTSMSLHLHLELPDKSLKSLKDLNELLLRQQVKTTLLEEGKASQ